MSCLAVFLSALSLAAYSGSDNGQPLIATTLGHALITRAYEHAEASLLAPLAYTEMVTSVILGWFFFGDFPDFWTFVGVGVLISCALYISMRERAAGKPPAPEAMEQP